MKSITTSGRYGIPLEQVIAACPALRQLDAERMRLMGQDIRMLSGLQSLTSIHISLEAASKCGYEHQKPLQALVRLTGLQALRLSSFSWCPEELQPLSALTQLTHLGLDW